MDRRFSLDRAMRDHQRRLLLLAVSILGLAQSGGVPHPHPHAQQPPHVVHHPFPHPHQCPHYGGCRQNQPTPFLPAQPGDTPDCARDGSTFCETIDTYPQHLIQYLAERLTYDYNTLLSDESREDFKAKKDEPTTPRPAPPVYHPPWGGHHDFKKNFVHYTYGPAPPRNPYNPAPYPAPQPIYNSINYSQPQVGGYPDRRYPLLPPQTYIPDNDPGLVYSALLQPELVAQYNPDTWWKRYSRSEGSTMSADKLRQRRQSQSGGNSTTTQLCPTRSSFIMPKAALNNKGNWMYVVNLDQDRYSQLVRSETCVSNQCNGICSLPNGYTSRCEQQYVQKRLVALEGGGNRLYTDVFWFPHCCICQITQNG
ncbi:hypothetical protein LSTR_LSTR009457 [Laodelphax striatellus]|uniref:Spaetzle domain-containing protein n=1 Tax=Laodelphax striatellus TaxID=195883 RepID=A0A482WFM6_LAOST|nr:hypothetical protein LSTR_LSTR009457 [Laodelphax striatellus]